MAGQPPLSRGAFDRAGTPFVCGNVQWLKGVVQFHFLFNENLITANSSVPSHNWGRVCLFGNYSGFHMFSPSLIIFGQPQIRVSFFFVPRLQSFNSALERNIAGFRPRHEMRVSWCLSFVLRSYRDFAPMTRKWSSSMATESPRMVVGVLPSSQQTYLWKITTFNGRFHYKCWFSACLPEGYLFPSWVSFGSDSDHSEHSFDVILLTIPHFDGDIVPCFRPYFVGDIILHGLYIGLKKNGHVW